MSMEWYECKFCNVLVESKSHVFKHLRLKHDRHYKNSKYSSFRDKLPDCDWRVVRLLKGFQVKLGRIEKNASKSSKEISSSYQCKLCGHSFTCQAVLNMHKRKNHSKPSTKTSAAPPIKRPQSKCAQCNSEFVHQIIRNYGVADSLSWSKLPQSVQIKLKNNCEEYAKSDRRKYCRHYLTVSENPSPSSPLNLFSSPGSSIQGVSCNRSGTRYIAKNDAKDLPFRHSAFSLSASEVSKTHGINLDVDYPLLSPKANPFIRSRPVSFKESPVIMKFNNMRMCNVCGYKASGILDLNQHRRLVHNQEMKGGRPVIQNTTSNIPNAL